jgi:Protein of unknown function (DUF4232)
MKSDRPNAMPRPAVSEVYTTAEGSPVAMPVRRHADTARHHAAILAFAVAALMVAAACSGASNHSSAATTPVTPPSTAPPTTRAVSASPASPASPRVTKASTGNAALGRCHTRDLAARTGDIGAALGSAGTTLTLTNTSSHGCTLYGYVGLVRLIHARQPMATTLRRGRSTIYSDPGPHRVTLAPGATASVGIGWGDNPVGNETERSCRRSRYLEITPPDETIHLVIRTQPIAACGGYLSVTAMQPGSKPAGP